MNSFLLAGLRPKTGTFLQFSSRSKEAKSKNQKPEKDLQQPQSLVPPRLKNKILKYHKMVTYDMIAFVVLILCI